MKYVRTLAALGAVAALGAIAAPASAATIIAMTGGSVAPGSELSIPATIVGTGGGIYDFTFTDSVATAALTQMQEATKSGDITISYDLYSGTPGSGTLLAAAGPSPAPTVSWNFTPGNYYVELVGATPGATITGGVSTAAVPEPATWAMLMAGFGMAGYALRRRRVSLQSA